MEQRAAKHQRSTPAKISSSEWAVMKILWKYGNLKASDITKLLEPEYHWSVKTVRTFLSRLVEKGAVGQAKIDRIYGFRAVMDEETALEYEINAFLNEYFNGSFEKMEKFWKGRKKR